MHASLRKLASRRAFGVSLTIGVLGQVSGGIRTRYRRSVSSLLYLLSYRLAKFLGVEPNKTRVLVSTTNFKSNGLESGGMGGREQRFETKCLQVHTPVGAFDSQPVSQNRFRLTGSYCRARASDLICANEFLNPLKIKG